MERRSAMSHMNRWIAAIAIVMSLFMGACATSPSREVLGQAAVTKRQYSIPDFGTLKLSVPPSWQEEINPKDLSSVFAFGVRYKEKARENFQVFILIQRETSESGSASDPERIRLMLTLLSSRYRARAVEKDIAIVDLPCKGGKGYYYSWTDATYKPGKPDDYQCMTLGMCPVGDWFLILFVFTNSKDSEVVDRALHAVRTAERVK
jgi:hypothetical protein